MGGICTAETARNSELKTELVGELNNEEKQQHVKANKIIARIEEPTEVEIIDEKKLQMKEFDDNIVNYGKYLSEAEKDERIHENVKRIEALINKFEPTSEELANYSNVFQKDPILFNDGSIYHGTWNYTGKKEGYGEYIKVDGSKYTGFWKDDKIEGRGRYIDKNANFYEGEWKNGMADGQGVLMVSQGSRYEGGWVKDLQEGYGEETFSDRTTYRGEYHNGHKHGKGTFTWSDGSYYTGDFVNSTITGFGALKWKDDRQYEGEWLNNKMHGKGTFTWPDGKKYVGEYKHDKKEGFGTYYWEPNKYYEGEWFNSRQHGEGKLVLNGKVLKGQFRFGKIIKKYDDNKEKEEPREKIESKDINAAPELNLLPEENANHLNVSDKEHHIERIGVGNTNTPII